MAKEFETKILNINKKEIHEKLISLGAEEKEELYIKQTAFNISNEPIEQYVMLKDRGNGHKTMVYKSKNGYDIGDTQEIEVPIDDYELTKEFLLALKFYRFTLSQERKRKDYVLNEITFSVDTWPKVKPFLEIESDSKEKVLEGVRLIEMEGEDEGDISHLEIYSREGLDLQSFKDLKFD